MTSPINIAISPPLSGHVEVFKNNISLGVINMSSVFYFDVGNEISLYSTPSENYTFSHYIQPNGNETTDPDYNDTISTDGEKTITAVFELIGTEKTYDCVNKECKENLNGNGEYNEPTCNNECSEVPQSGSDMIGIAIGAVAIAWILFRKLKED